jgi:tricarballylate dehydrogenase
VAHLLRDEYRIREVTRTTDSTLEGLAAKLPGIDQARFLTTVTEFNTAVDESRSFNPNVKDGRRAVGLALDKTNWANPIEVPPFTAYEVTCGLTFTFGGLRIDKQAHVLDDDGHPIPGLYACGEMTGGIFYFNYPGGSGLTNGSVFGRVAGRHAGLSARRGGRRASRGPPRAPVSAPGGRRTPPPAAPAVPARPPAAGASSGTPRAYRAG